MLASTLRLVLMEDIRIGSAKAGDVIVLGNNAKKLVMRDFWNGRKPVPVDFDTPQAEIEQMQREAKREASPSQRLRRKPRRSDVSTANLTTRFGRHPAANARAGLCPSERGYVRCCVDSTRNPRQPHSSECS